MRNLTRDELAKHLERLPPGKIEVLSKEQFEYAFGPPGPDTLAESAAIQFGEAWGCRVIFLRFNEAFVTFGRDLPLGRRPNGSV